MKKFANFDVGKEAVQKLTTIIMYAVIINTFFFLLEFFVGYYSEVPGHMHSLEYLFFGLEHDGHVYNNLVPFMWTSVIFNFTGLGILAYMKIAKVFDIPFYYIPKTKQNKSAQEKKELALLEKHKIDFSNQMYQKSPE